MKWKSSHTKASSKDILSHSVRSLTFARSQNYHVVLFFAKTLQTFKSFWTKIPQNFLLFVWQDCILSLLFCFVNGKFYLTHLNIKLRKNRKFHCVKNYVEIFCAENYVTRYALVFQWLPCFTFLSPPPGLCWALSREPTRESTFHSTLWFSICFARKQIKRYLTSYKF